MQYVDDHGRSIRLGAEIGKGGEGSAYEIVGAPDMVAKIYHSPATKEKATKLSAMTQIATPKLLQVAAWPKATLRTQRGGAVVGIVLPRIKNSHEIHELYGPAHRKVRFPNADWRFLVRTARNCAAAFSALHRRQIVIGDVNQGNVFVSPKAMVALIDCDSFQLSANGRLYRCPVGVAHFVPPELQSSRLADITRTTNHDSFGLAILIFHLLFMGRHPFAGQYSGQGEPSIENHIRDYRFAYGSSATRLHIGPPPNALTLGHLPRELANLFERAFTRGSESSNARPTSETWVHALDQLERHLAKCKDDPGHVFAAHLRRCPWCDVLRAGGPNFFISVTVQRSAGRATSFDLAVIWAKIQAVPRPDENHTRTRRAHVGIVPRPVPETSDRQQLLRHAVGIVSAMAVVLSLLFFAFEPFALFSIPISLVFGGWWLVLRAKSPLQRIRQERRRASQRKTQELDRSRINQRAGAQHYLSQFDEKLASLREYKTTYEQLKSRRDAEYRDLQRTASERQLDEHLRQCFISDAVISGIGEGRIAALESYGIETASDIEKWTIMNVPGFGEKLTEKLLRWRVRKESEFRFNPTKGVPQADVQALEMKYVQIKTRCELNIGRGPAELAQISDAARAALKRLDSAVARLEREAAQCRADYRVVSSIPWWH